MCEFFLLSVYTHHLSCVTYNITGRSIHTWLKLDCVEIKINKCYELNVNEYKIVNTTQLWLEPWQMSMACKQQQQQQVKSDFDLKTTTS